MYNVSDTPCGSATLRGPMEEDRVVKSVLRVNASFYREDPIVIRCQLDLTADPNVDYNLRLKIEYTSLDEPRHLWLTNQSSFNTLSEGNVIYYNVSINASPKLERSIIACGAEVRPRGSLGPFQHCYTKSFAIIIFRDYDLCDHPTDTPVITPTTSSTNSPTSKLVTTNSPTATPVTTPITPSTVSTSKLVTTETATASSVTTPTTPPPPNFDPPVPIIEIFSSVTGIAILVGIILLVANVIQLGVIIIMRNRRSNPRVQISATNDAALEQQDIEMDCGLESEEGTTIQNGLATDSG